MAFTTNFNSFKQSFATNVSNLKRRFSSGDLSSEGGGGGEDEVLPSESLTSSPRSVTSQGQSSGVVGGGGELTGGVSRGGSSSSTTTQQNAPMPPSTISAPTSPVKSNSLLQRVQSLTGAVTKEVTSTVTNVIDKYTVGTTNVRLERDPKELIILILDDYKTEWSKYFPSTLGPFSLKCIQLTVDSLSSFSTDTNTIIIPTSSQLAPFIPDFIFFRQVPTKELLLSCSYSALDSLDSLRTHYLNLDRCLVFSELARLKLPTIEQIYYSGHKAMGPYYFKGPSVLKFGSHVGGVGKVRVKDVGEWQDVVGVAKLTGSYATCEPYIETKTEICLQKIGSQVKAFQKKSLGPFWKSSNSTTILEEIPLSERHSSYIDLICRSFNLSIFQLKLLSPSPGREFLIELNDSASLSLIGETQEGDRKLMAELIINKLSGLSASEEWCRRRVGGGKGGGRRGSVSEEGGAGSGTRRDSQGSGASSAAGKFFRQISTEAEGEDTMKNLRKTFAGIFGDM